MQRCHVRATSFKLFIHLFKRHLLSTAHAKPYAITGDKKNKDAASTLSITEAKVMSPRGRQSGPELAPILPCCGRIILVVILFSILISKIGIITEFTSRGCEE